MAPREHLEAIVRPNLADFRANYGEVRLAFNAVAAADSFAAHIQIP